LVNRIKPVEIKIIGHFLCTPILTPHFSLLANLITKSKNFFEYPRHIIEKTNKVLKLAKLLQDYFGKYIIIKIVNYFSLLGLFLMMRYKLKGEIVLLVNKKIVHLDKLELDELIKIIEKEICRKNELI